MSAEILVVDDEADIRELVGGILQDEGYVVRTAGNSADTLAAVRARAPRLVVLDVWLKGSELDGLGILSILKEMDPFLPVVVISGHGTVETAVEAIRRGAYDYLEKPFKSEKLIVTVQRALENAALKRANSRLMARSASSKVALRSCRSLRVRSRTSSVISGAAAVRLRPLQSPSFTSG